MRKLLHQTHTHTYVIAVKIQGIGKISNGNSASENNFATAQVKQQQLTICL